MLALLTLALAAQEPRSDALEYLRLHRNAHAALVSKKLDDARTGFERCLALSPWNATVEYELACIEARAANPAKALELLEHAVEWGYLDADVATWDADLASLRKEKRFTSALDRMRELAAEEAREPCNVRILDGGDWDPSTDVAVDPNGQFVAVAQRSGVVSVLDFATGHLLRSSPPLGSAVWAIAVDKDGKRVAALTWDGKLHFWGVDGKTAPQSAPAIEPPEAWEQLRAPSGGRVQFDPTGARVLVSGDNRGASVWSSSGELLRAWREVKTHGVVPAWSPDGALIALAENSVVQFNGIPTEPSGVAPLQTVKRVTCVAFHPNGRFVATGHVGCVRLWDLASRRRILERRFDERKSWARAVEFSPDGRFIAVEVEDRTQRDRTAVEILDSTSGKLTAAERCGGHEPLGSHDLAWSSDSNRAWFTCTCGHKPLMEFTVDKSAPEMFAYIGRAPLSGKFGLAFATTVGGILALDESNGNCRWNRPNLSRAGEILKTSTGHFTTDLESLEELWVDTCEQDDLTPLADLVTQLFDPKRVRAARAGVTLVPVDFTGVDCSR